MRVSGRPGTLGVGDRVRYGGVALTVVGVSGTLVRLSDVAGAVTELPLPVLQAGEDFALVEGSGRPALPPTVPPGTGPAPVRQVGQVSGTETFRATRPFPVSFAPADLVSGTDPHSAGPVAVAAVGR